MTKPTRTRKVKAWAVFSSTPGSFCGNYAEGEDQCAAIFVEEYAKEGKKNALAWRNKWFGNMPANRHPIITVTITYEVPHNHKSKK